ncbi:MAG: epoxyqueuosine reductase QueH [Candidatus Shapirobacteria bacterium]|nr:epoxyqueuosine reductase QueH [Candidatus Shapirobacteria bacterium]
MRLLIHACCADCLLKMIESIKRENNLSEITVYYYNPNIHPRSEYQSRLKAMKLMIGDLKMVVADWKPREWFETQNPSKSPFDKRETLKLTRCVKCWKLRLEKTAEYAKKNGFDWFSSTLLTSEYQNTKKIEEIGKEISKKHNIQFLIPNKICKKLETKGFYKQVFCGCCYSLTERFEEKFL